MFGTIIAAIGGAIVGGVVQGVATTKANKAKVEAYKDAAKKVRKATEEYSGKKGFEKQFAEGIDTAGDLGTAMANQVSANTYVPNAPGTTGTGVLADAYGNAKGAADATQNMAENGFYQGMSNQANLNAANYNKETAEADLAMKQADIDYNVANQTAQEVLNGASNIAKTAQQTGLTPGEIYSRSKDNGRRGKPVVSGNPLMD